MIVLVAVLGIACIILGYIIFNLNRKYERLEREYEGLEQKCLDLTQELVEQFFSAQQQLARVDRRGSFASDDEVGFVFTIIKNTVAELVEFLKKLQEQINGEEEK